MRAFSLELLAPVALLLSGCSPGTSSNALDDGLGQSGAGAGAASGAGSGATSGTGSISGLGGDPGIIVTGRDSGIAPRPGNDASCGALTQEPEKIIVYRDATVTDTTYTYSPVALYIMQDRSYSMVSGIPGGSAESWNNSTAALNGFVSDPASAGLDVGLAFFPPTANNQGACDGSDCGVPSVEIGPIAQTGPQIVSSMNANPPAFLNLTPTECGLNGMINHCVQWTQASGEQCVGILITDGDPTVCDGNIANLSQLVANGLAAGVKTFVIRLPGVNNPGGLDQIAAAGGTGASIDVASGALAFIGALNSIRQSIAHTESHQTTTQTVVSTPLDCQWKIPAPKNGEAFDADKVNVQFTPVPNTPPIGYGRVPSEADCARAGDGWYYDDLANPTQVFVCPQTCGAIKASTDGKVDLLFGCKTKEVLFQ